MFADCQSQTSTAFVPAPGRIRAVKSFKNPLKVFFFNTNSVVCNFYENMFPIRRIYAGNNTAILFSVFGSILHQIQQTILIFSLSAKTKIGYSQPFLIPVRIFLSCILMERDSKTSRIRSWICEIFFKQQLFSSFQFGNFIQVVHKIYQSFYISFCVFQETFLTFTSSIAPFRRCLRSPESQKWAFLVHVKDFEETPCGKLHFFAAFQFPPSVYFPIFPRPHALPRWFF